MSVHLALKVVLPREATNADRAEVRAVVEAALAEHLPGSALVVVDGEFVVQLPERV